MRSHVELTNTRSTIFFFTEVDDPIFFLITHPKKTLEQGLDVAWQVIIILITLLKAPAHTGRQLNDSFHARHFPRLTDLLETCH